MGDGITSWQPFDRLRAFSKQEKAGVVEQGADSMELGYFGFGIVDFGL